MAVLPGKSDAPHLRQRPLRFAESRGARQQAGNAGAGRVPAAGPRSGDPPGRRPRRSGESAARPLRSAAASRSGLQHRRSRRQRRRQRDGAVDGAGARVRGERDRIRRDARLHDGGRRGAGADRIGRPSRRRPRSRRSPSRPGSTTTSSAARTAATASSTARRSGSTRRARSIRPRARSRCSPGGWRREYVPSHRVRLMARRGSLQPRGRSQRLSTRPGLCRDRLPRVARELRQAARAHDTIDGVDFHYLAQNANVNAAAMATLALAPPPPSSCPPRGSPDARPPALRLRRPPALEGLPRRRLATGSSGAMPGRRTGNTTSTVGSVTEIHVPAHEHRRLGIRRRRRRRRGPREHDQRVRRAPAVRRLTCRGVRPATAPLRQSVRRRWPGCVAPVSAPRRTRRSRPERSPRPR